MSPRRTERFRRAVLWLVPAAALTLTPKCLLCLLGYAGLGAALGLGGPELCGAPTSQSHDLPWLLAASSVMSVSSAVYFRYRQPENR